MTSIQVQVLLIQDQGPGQGVAQALWNIVLIVLHMICHVRNTLTQQSYCHSLDHPFGSQGPGNKS